MDPESAYKLYQSELRDHVAGGGLFRDFPDKFKDAHGKETQEAVRVHACEVHGIPHRG